MEKPNLSQAQILKPRLVRGLFWHENKGRGFRARLGGQSEPSGSKRFFSDARLDFFPLPAHRLQSTAAKETQT